jgi:hypothetical protein
MAEFLVLSRDNRVIRCEGDGFAWGNMESKASFDRQYPFKTYPGKLSLIKCPGMSKAQGEGYVGSVFSPSWLDEQSRDELAIDFETAIPDWQLQMSLSDG